MTVDEQPYYSPTAVAFCLEQPCALPSEDNYRQRKQQESNPLLRMTPGYEVADTCNLLFEAALDRAFRDLDNWRRGDDLRPLLSRLAEHCFKAGIPEEEAVRQTLMHYYREADEPLVRLTLHNLYGELKGFGTRSSLNKDQETAFRLEEFMKRRYEFRYNTVLGDLEYRQRDSIHFYFKPADQRVRSSIAMNALKEGIRVWDRDITRFLALLPADMRVLVEPNRTAGTLVEIIGRHAVHAESAVALFKAIKNDIQIQGTREAMERDGVALVRTFMAIEEALASGKTITEIDVDTLATKFRSEQPLYFDNSFSTIAGYGPHGAIVHYSATTESSSTLRPESLLLVDSGAQYLDGTTDITRTIALGTPTDLERRDFTLVMKGHIALARTVFPAGTRGDQLDAIARHLIQTGRLMKSIDEPKKKY